MPRSALLLCLASCFVNVPTPDSEHKFACESPDHCLGGFTCQNHICVRAEQIPPPVNGVDCANDGACAADDRCVQIDGSLGRRCVPRCSQGRCAGLATHACGQVYDFRGDVVEACVACAGCNGVCTASADLVFADDPRTRCDTGQVSTGCSNTSGCAEQNVCVSDANGNKMCAPACAAGACAAGHVCAQVWGPAEGAVTEACVQCGPCPNGQSCIAAREPEYVDQPHTGCVGTPPPPGDCGGRTCSATEACVLLSDRVRKECRPTCSDACGAGPDRIAQVCTSVITPSNGSALVCIRCDTCGPGGSCTGAAGSFVDQATYTCGNPVGSDCGGQTCTSEQVCVLNAIGQTWCADSCGPTCTPGTKVCMAVQTPQSSAAQVCVSCPEGCSNGCRVRADSALPVLSEVLEVLECVTLAPNPPTPPLPDACGGERGEWCDLALQGPGIESERVNAGSIAMTLDNAGRPFVAWLADNAGTNALRYNFWLGISWLRPEGAVDHLQSGAGSVAVTLANEPSTPLGLVLAYVENSYLFVKRAARVNEGQSSLLFEDYGSHEPAAGIGQADTGARISMAVGAKSVIAWESSGAIHLRERDSATGQWDLAAPDLSPFASGFQPALAMRKVEHSDQRYEDSYIAYYNVDASYLTLHLDRRDFLPEQPSEFNVWRRGAFTQRFYGVRSIRPQVVIHKNGNADVVWDDGSLIHVIRYALNAAHHYSLTNERPIAPEFTTCTEPTATVDHRDWLVVAMHCRNDSGYQGIAVRVYSEDLVPNGWHAYSIRPGGPAPSFVSGFTTSNFATPVIVGAERDTQANMLCVAFVENELLRVLCTQPQL